MIVTLDGPAGVGKSTVARILADKLSLPYLNSGEMFRQLALHVGKDVDTLSDEELGKKMRECVFSLHGAGQNAQLLCNGKPGGEELRSETTASLASKLGLRQEARDFLVEAQRQIGMGDGLVTEGRDMGTVVFPKAEHKFFLDASPEVRAKRRFLELAALGQNVPLAEIEAAIRKRDHQDRNRPIAPLAPARNAMLVDTSSLTIDEVVHKIMAAIQATSV